MAMCECKVCQNGRMFRHKLSEIPEDKRPFFEEVYEELMELQMDNDYLRCIMNGSWTGAVEILENALVKAKEHQKLREELEEQLPQPQEEEK